MFSELVMLVSESDVTFDTPGQLKFVSRNDWIAQPPEENPIPLDLPSTRVIIAHTGTFDTFVTAQFIFILSHCFFFFGFSYKKLFHTSKSYGFH